MPPKTRLAAKRKASETDNLPKAPQPKKNKVVNEVNTKMQRHNTKKSQQETKQLEPLDPALTSAVFGLKELFFHIASCLFKDIDTLIALSQISKRHHAWISSPELWQSYGLLNINFSLTCKNLRLQDNILTADCRDKSGQYHTSSVDLDRVLRNTDGVLTPGHNFSHSSSDIELDLSSEDKPILRAQCRNCQGYEKESWVNLNAVVGNQGGRLVVTDGFVVQTYFVRKLPNGFWSDKFSKKAYLKKYQAYDCYSW